MILNNNNCDSCSIIKINIVIHDSDGNPDSKETNKLDALQGLQNNTGK